MEIWKASLDGKSASWAHEGKRMTSGLIALSEFPPICTELLKLKFVLERLFFRFKYRATTEKVSILFKGRRGRAGGKLWACMYVMPKGRLDRRGRYAPAVVYVEHSYGVHTSGQIVDLKFWIHPLNSLGRNFKFPLRFLKSCTSMLPISHPKCFSLSKYSLTSQGPFS